MPEKLRTYSGRVNALKRHRAPGDPAITDAERELRAASLAARIREAVESWPPLTGAQRDRLALLLHPGGGDAG